MSDFFGYNVRLSDTPVEIDVDEIMGRAQQDKLPYRDLSSDGDYISVGASVSSDTPGCPPPPQKSTPRRPQTQKLLSMMATGLGAAMAIWMTGNLAIASRSGGMDNIRAHHLGSASRSLPVLALLGAAGAIEIKRRFD